MAHVVVVLPVASSHSHYSGHWGNNHARGGRFLSAILAMSFMVWLEQPGLHLPLARGAGF